MSESDAVELDPSVGTAAKKMSSKVNFALVVFRGIEDSYLVGTNVECRYAISRSLEVTARDWVGLYRVGWRNQSDYIYYEWSPAPQTDGADVTSSIVFPANRLPKDDGEFYQFCYVTSQGHVRGASTPFQFKKQSIDDLIEIEDENGELLIIKTKTAVLEEQLKKANDTRLQLKQEIQFIENEKDILRRNENDLQKKLLRQKDMAEGKIKEMMEMITDGTHQNDHLQDCINNLQEKIEVINQEKLSMEKRLDDSDRYIGSLQEKIKTLVNEKDALTGRVKSLEEEKELYKNHCTRSEETLQAYAQECERVRLALIDGQEDKARLKKDLERVDAELSEQRRQHDVLAKQAQAEKDNMEYLTERLRNAEDKLSAAEHCKMMLNEEVLTLKQAYEKIFNDLEGSRVTLDKLAQQESAAAARAAEEIDAMQCKMAAVERQLSDKRDEASELSAEVARLQGELLERSAVEKVEADGPLYALQTAHNTLTARYTKLEKKNDELHRSLEQAMCRIRELNETDDDQKHEISSLRDRLLMGQEAYKEKYIEWERLDTQLYKLRMSKRASASSKESTPLTAVACASQTSSVDQPQRQSAMMQTSVCVDGGDGLEALSSAEVQQQLTDLSAELEKRFSKARKYKRLYHEQSEKCAEMSAQLEENSAEIEHLKNLIKSSHSSTPYAHSIAMQSPDICPPSEQAASGHVERMMKVKEFDPLNQSDEQCCTLVTPLKPLPAPILPERLHSARVASIKHAAVSDIGLNVVSKMLDMAGPTAPPRPPPPPISSTVVSSATSYVMTSSAGSSSMTTACTAITAASPTAPAAASAVEEDRFVDAPGEPQDCSMTCPFCQTVFPAEFVTQAEFEEHIDTHLSEDHGPICPMCPMAFDSDMSNLDFEHHVNGHFST